MTLFIGVTDSCVLVADIIVHVINRGSDLCSLGEKEEVAPGQSAVQVDSVDLSKVTVLVIYYTDIIPLTYHLLQHLTLETNTDRGSIITIYKRLMK